MIDYFLELSKSQPFRRSRGGLEGLGERSGLGAARGPSLPHWPNHKNSCCVSSAVHFVLKLMRVEGTKVGRMQNVQEVAAGQVADDSKAVEDVQGRGGKKLNGMKAKIKMVSTLILVLFFKRSFDPVST